ncbi:uncharacterized protein LOC113126960 isoform X2 [Mastacembelus armatus]|uniref:uncharacterized protein LOC113126960 isoform X2 n=1 Tax=Mastacembelus armatus TaxID=205130 RepID=UPI000E45BA65|nr:uncharacterized protein LOC113126960 isoform X2 [Mastacembelus armatus]
MLSFMVFCSVWFLTCSDENSTEGFRPVRRFSVPEDHHVCLRCGGSNRSDVVWTHQDWGDQVSPYRDSETDEDALQRHRRLPDGGLCLQKLQDSDSGMYRCNQQPVAELQVLTGLDFRVSAGRTLLLPCSRSSRPKQRWYQRRPGGRREAILTRFKNGTVKPEREGGRLSYKDDALQILDLQPEDMGDYECNGDLQGRVTVLTVIPDPTSIQSTSSTASSPAVVGTEVVETKKEEKRRAEKALLLAAVVGLGLMILLLAVVCLLLTNRKCIRKHKYSAAQRHEDTELQPWKTTSRQTECEVSESPSLPEETIHYASLGRQNWRERPSRTPRDQEQQSVIYSSIVTRACPESHTQPRRFDMKLGD